MYPLLNILGKSRTPENPKIVRTRVEGKQNEIMYECEKKTARGVYMDSVPLVKYFGENTNTRKPENRSDEGSRQTK